MATKKRRAGKHDQQPDKVGGIQRERVDAAIANVRATANELSDSMRLALCLIANDAHDVYRVGCPDLPVQTVKALQRRGLVECEGEHVWATDRGRAVVGHTDLGRKEAEQASVQDAQRCPTDQLAEWYAERLGVNERAVLHGMTRLGGGTVTHPISVPDELASCTRAMSGWTSPLVGRGAGHYAGKARTYYLTKLGERVADLLFGERVKQDSPTISNAQHAASIAATLTPSLRDNVHLTCSHRQAHLILAALHGLLAAGALEKAGQSAAWDLLRTLTDTLRGRQV